MSDRTENQQSNAQTINDNGAREIERLHQALEDAADMLHECALECSNCDYGNGATGKDSEGEICEECAPVRPVAITVRPSWKLIPGTRRLIRGRWVQMTMPGQPGAPVFIFVDPHQALM